LVSLADVVAFKISRFYTLAKGAHEDIKALGVEIRSLYGVLSSLKLLASCLEAECPPPSYGMCPFSLLNIVTCWVDDRKYEDARDGSFPYLPREPWSIETDFREVRSGFYEAVDTIEDEVVVAFEIERDQRTRWKDCKEQERSFRCSFCRRLVRLNSTCGFWMIFLTFLDRTALVEALSSQKRLTETVEDVQLQLQQMAEEKAENEQGKNSMSTIINHILISVKMNTREKCLNGVRK
jgi:hypothetical protein